MIDFNTVWTNLNNDPAFEKNIPAVRDAVKPHIEQLTMVLFDWADQIVTLRNFSEARWAVAKYFVESRYLEDTVAAVSDEDLFFFGRSDLIEMSRSMLKSAISAYEGLADDVEAFLTEHELTEEQILLSPKVGLLGEARQLYKDQKLTIGKLFELQPSVLIDFTK